MMKLAIVKPMILVVTTQRNQTKCINAKRNYISRLKMHGCHLKNTLSLISFENNIHEILRYIEQLKHVSQV